MWMRNYFEQELNIPVYFEPKMYEWNQKRFSSATAMDWGLVTINIKCLKGFPEQVMPMVFGVLHPSWGIGLANYFSKEKPY